MLLVQAHGLHVYSIYFCWGTLHCLQQYLWLVPADLAGSPWGFGPGREQYWGHQPGAVPATLLQAKTPDSGGQPYLPEAKCRICRGEDLVCTYCVIFLSVLFNCELEMRNISASSYCIILNDGMDAFPMLILWSHQYGLQDDHKWNTELLVKTQAFFPAIWGKSSSLGVWALEQVSQKGCGVSFPGDTQNSSGYDPMQPTPGEPALAEGLD